MANTFTQIHIQMVFVVKYRRAQIAKSWKEELYKYITAIIQSKDHKLLAINGMPDHIHVLIGLRPNQALSDLVREIKANSSKWINERRFLDTEFHWQSGFGAFSYSKSQVPQVIAYIENQEKHHSKISFREEYKDFLEKFEVDYDERYIFQELE